MHRLLITSADRCFWSALDAEEQTALSDFAVTRTYDTDSMREALDREPPSLWIVDMELADQAAFPLLARFSQDFEDIPVIVMSAVASRLVNIRLRDIGSLRVARKPVGLSGLAKLAHQLLEHAVDPAKAQGIPLSTFLYLIDMEGGDCRLRLTDRFAGKDGVLDIVDGGIRGAATSDGLDGGAAAMDMAGWEASEIRLEEVPLDAYPRGADSGLEISKTLIAGVGKAESNPHASREQRIARRRWVEPERFGDFNLSTASSTEILKQLLEIDGVEAAMVVARDGFVAETIGQTRGMDIDQIGASLGVMFNGVEGVVSELEIKPAGKVIVEYGDVTIICIPVGSALLTLFVTDAGGIGLIRVQAQRYVQRLAELF